MEKSIDHDFGSESKEQFKLEYGRVGIGKGL